MTYILPLFRCFGIGIYQILKPWYKSEAVKQATMPLTSRTNMYSMFVFIMAKVDQVYNISVVTVATVAISISSLAYNLLY